MAELYFGGIDFLARRSGALWWPERRMLVVADLHLGRAERYARRGGPLLPPWEVADTLDRLEAEIATMDPATVISLGDSFDDDLAGKALDAAVRRRLSRLARARDWVWIAGNHDRQPPGPGLPGRWLPELSYGVTFRHEAGAGPDISGHLHPVVPLAGRRWRCFAVGADHLILPAFGTYTGGLGIHAPALRNLIPRGRAICCSEAMFAVPLPMAGT